MKYISNLIISAPRNKAVKGELFVIPKFPLGIFMISLRNIVEESNMCVRTH